MQVWNLWGGLIYLLAPPKTQVQGVEVTVQQAVLAPYYKSGESVEGKRVQYKICSICFFTMDRISPTEMIYTSLECTHFFFVLPGVTTAAEWSLLRSAPSPWAEVESDNVIFSVPSTFIRDLERPDEVTATWNKIMNAIADLAVIPHKFPRKERFVTDVQISHGK